MKLEKLTKLIEKKRIEFDISKQEIALTLGYAGRQVWEYKIRHDAWYVKDIVNLAVLFKMKPEEFFIDENKI